VQTLPLALRSSEGSGIGGRVDAQCDPFRSDQVLQACEPRFWIRVSYGELVADARSGSREAFPKHRISAQEVKKIAQLFLPPSGLPGDKKLRSCKARSRRPGLSRTEALAADWTQKATWIKVGDEVPADSAEANVVVALNRLQFDPRSGASLVIRF
jgi:hypothetical protein